jgi:hypothetical protein
MVTGGEKPVEIIKCSLLCSNRNSFPPSFLSVSFVALFKRHLCHNEWPVTDSNHIIQNCIVTEICSTSCCCQVLGFGAMWICRLMPTFWRNMLSPSSGAEVTRQGIRGLISWRARVEGREPVGENMGKGMWTNRESWGRLQGGGWVWSGRREENGLFQGSPEGIMFLLGDGVCSLQLWVRGFRDLLREKPSSLLMLFRWSSICIASLMVRSMYLDLLARIVVLYIWIQ